MEGQGLDSCGSGLENMTDSFEHRNEHSGSTKCWEIFDYMGH
jgi:hypothetical protein